MSKIKNGGLDQYGAKPFERRQFGTAGVEGGMNSVLTDTDALRVLASSVAILCSYAVVGVRGHYK